MIFSLTKSDIIQKEYEVAKKTFGEEFLNYALTFCNDSNMEIFTFFYLLRQKLEGKTKFEQLHLTLEQLELLNSLFQRYLLKIKAQQAFIENITPGKAGRFVNEILTYDEEKYPIACGNREVKYIEQIMLLKEFFGVDTEFRIAFTGADIPLYTHVQPQYSRDLSHEEELLFDKLSFLLEQHYEKLLREAGYALDAKAKEYGPVKFYRVSFGCEEFDFPDEFAAHGSKLVLSKEEAIKFLRKRKKFYLLEENFVKVDLNNDNSCTLTMSESRLDQCKNEGFAFSYSGLKTVHLKPSFFQEEAGKVVYIDGKKRIQFFIP